MRRLAGATAVESELALGARLEGDTVLVLRCGAAATLAGLGRGGSLVLLRRRHLRMREVPGKSWKFLCAGNREVPGKFWWKQVLKASIPTIVCHHACGIEGTLT